MSDRGGWRIVGRSRRRGGARRWTRRSWWIGVLVGLASWPLAAQDEAAGPRFFIETIRVENAVRFPAEIIVSESLLEEGRVYSERELRDAVHRIVRLPLILEAEFALRKGSERERYVLLITVQEARRWFFGVDVDAELGDDVLEIPGLDFPADDDDLGLFAGWRIPAGRHGVVSLAADPTDGGTVQLGYSHFDLFGRSVQLNANLLYEPLDREGIALDNQQLRLSLGIPIRGNHSLRLSGSYRATELGFTGGTFGLDAEAERLIAGLSWVYNSVDDPVFPTSGSFLRSGVEYRRSEDRQSRFFVDSNGLPARATVDSEARQVRLVLTGDRYWPLTRSQTVSVSLDLSAGRAQTPRLFLFGEPAVELESDLDVWEAGLNLGHAWFLWRDQESPRWRELRWENEIGLFHEGTSPDLGLPWNPRSGVWVNSGLRFRTSWGVFRYQVSWIGSGDGR